MIIKSKIKSDKRPYDKALADAVIAALDVFAPDDATFSEIRSALDKTEKQLPDGWIHQIATDHGYDVEI